MSRLPGQPCEISIILPAYNGRDTLARAIESVRGQAFPHWELLAVDDGSTDGSAELLETWASRDSRIRVLRTPENRGIGAARNVALPHAQGEWICYLDRDDEFYPDYLQHVASWQGRADVLIFEYDVVAARADGTRQVTRWNPQQARGRMFLVNPVTPLGVAHRRELLEQTGGFHELLCREADWDLWKRMARAGAEFAFLPWTSGRYYVRGDSNSRRPHVPAWTRRQWEANVAAGRPLYGKPLGTIKRRAVESIVFASPHCLVDFTSGAAVATSQQLQFLNRLGFHCQAFCGMQLDGPREALLEQMLAEQGAPYETRNVTIGDYEGRMVFTMQGNVPVTVFQTAATRGRWAGPLEAAAFLAAYEKFLDANRPDVVLTYGGDPVAQSLRELTRSRDIPVVFALHNLQYPSTDAFRTADYVTVPSEFSRRHHWETLGLACQVLPNVVDWNRVRAETRRPQYVTFVNPQPAKGLTVFARIAEQLALRRPDIPLLVVEARGETSSLEAAGPDLSRASNISIHRNTPDPREFYAVSKLLLMPSLTAESFGLTALEAMINGIPVLASDRGALPETVGEGGFMLPVPPRCIADRQAVPTAEEAASWVEAIIRLWDDEQFHQQATRRALSWAERRRPDRLAEHYRKFFASIVPQPGPPFVPLPDASVKRS